MRLRWPFRAASLEDITHHPTPQERAGLGLLLALLDVPYHHLVVEPDRGRIVGKPSHSTDVAVVLMDQRGLERRSLTVEEAIDGLRRYLGERRRPHLDVAAFRRSHFMRSARRRSAQIAVAGPAQGGS